MWERGNEDCITVRKENANIVYVLGKLGHPY